jgi:hypothetical protein
MTNELKRKYGGVTTTTIWIESRPCLKNGTGVFLISEDCSNGATIVEESVDIGYWKAYEKRFVYPIDLNFDGFEWSSYSASMIVERFELRKI